MTHNDPAAAPPLRVAFYMHDLSGGGVERMRLALIAELKACGLDVTLVVGAKQGPLLPFLPADLKVISLGAKRTLFSVWGLVKFLRAEQPNVLVSSLNHNNIAAMLARRISGVSTRLVICQHNTLSGEQRLGWKYRAVPWAYWLLQHEADAIVAVSQGVAEDLARVARIPPRNISVIYNPVIDKGFSGRVLQPPPHAWLAKKDCPVFVFVGRLTAQKDAHTLLAAMEIALLRCSARLILLGKGEEEPELRRFAREACIEHAVGFVGFQANPLPWIRHADALVSSSRYEGLGNAIIEALACGTQVIATDCPHGPAEILLDGKLGRLVPVGDASALADALANHNSFYYDPAQRRARANDFTATACAQQHIRLFEKIIGRQRKVVHALGMNISPLRTHEVVDAIIHGGAKESVQLVVTPNLDHVRRLRAPDFAAAYASAHLVCPDGLPVLLYARLRGLKLSGRVTGCDVFARLIRHKDLHRQRLFLVVESGATALAATQWAEHNAISEQTEIAVAPFGLGTDEPSQLALAQRIARAAPTILVMTLGAPVSEVFIHRHRHALPPCWALCVGQALRVELALARRAPPLWQAFGFEWLWRLGHEPRRLWGRYTRSLAWFPVAIWRDVMRL
jgi:exopolysaccharide biosynthesis WecB/TagA/CpsF family protein